MTAPPANDPKDLDELAARLHRMSKNIWWSWNPPAQELFRALAPRTWRNSGHNAVAVMQALSSAELRANLCTPQVGPWARRVADMFEKYLSDANTWASFHAPEIDYRRPVAYFSAEFGLHESIPIYSGGLGILSGDHMKSASDLGLPCVGVGLLYRHGYFTQRLDPNGWQQEAYPTVVPEKLPMEPVLDAEGRFVTVGVRIGHAAVSARAYRVNIGRVTLHLLDTDMPENEQHWREITGRVYGGDQMTRIGQELVMGVGGLRLLEALGREPSVYHLNEGHSAFLILELLRREVEKGASLAEASARVREKVVFTTHTPVAAGHDRFSVDLCSHMLVSWPEKLKCSFEEFMALGRENPDDPHEPFCMTVLALRHCRAANAVSELNGQVSREMWKPLYARPEMKDAPPIGHITNGVHVLGWMNRITFDFWEQKLGGQWMKHLKQADFWEKVADEEFLSDEEIWGLRYRLKRQMIEAVRARVAELRLRMTGSGHEAEETALDPDALTIGFSRRFATYKRAPLLFSDLERTARLFNATGRPVQILYAGKAHPRDDAGKSFIQQIVNLSRDPRFLGKVFFVEGYDIELARLLVSGTDVWLNNPRRPLEASGTSGQKISVHGGINFSIMDGWWREGYDGHNGFAIGKDENTPDPADQDRVDLAALYDVLENQIVPEFYDRDGCGLPRKWIRRIRRAMATLIPKYTTDRMVAEYTEKYYRRRG